jgi:hypothetical protein
MELAAMNFSFQFKPSAQSLLDARKVCVGKI